MTTFVFDWHLISGNSGKEFITQAADKMAMQPKWHAIRMPKTEPGQRKFDDWHPFIDSPYVTYAEATGKAESAVTNTTDTMVYPVGLAFFKVVSQAGLVYYGHPEKEWGRAELLKDLADDSDTLVYISPQVLKSANTF
jgi:hypothetical protein